MVPKFGQTAGIEIIVFFPFVFFKGYVFKFCDVFIYILKVYNVLSVLYF